MRIPRRPNIVPNAAGKHHGAAPAATAQRIAAKQGTGRGIPTQNARGCVVRERVSVKLVRVSSVPLATTSNATSPTTTAALRATAPVYSPHGARGECIPIIFYLPFISSGLAAVCREVRSSDECGACGCWYLLGPHNVLLACARPAAQRGTSSGRAAGETATGRGREAERHPASREGSGSAVGETGRSECRCCVKQRISHESDPAPGLFDTEM
ncbi:hypothetical protein B0H11DRAFT_355543 [Mycena galericulata]|nr:hypothetical protein B0H11DRAFT_355543 [Mycena galericulata]